MPIAKVRIAPVEHWCEIAAKRLNQEVFDFATRPEVANGR